MSNYIKPTTMIMAVATQQMIAATVTGVDGLGFKPGEGTTSMDAKGGFLWDEDDDDDPMGAPSFDIWEE
jgi:hypothetical protein